jgi:probable phosphoglycerate mutase
VRHGETSWSRTGKHTSRTNVRLTAKGHDQARQLGDDLRDHPFALVLSSPMARALVTARLAGFGERVEVDHDLREWDYGRYEGLTTPGIRRKVQAWTVWTHPVPGGETAAEVGARADRTIVRIRSAPGDVLLFAHGHFLRVLAARWVGLEPTAGARLALGTASLSVLGWEHGRPVIERWNVDTSDDRLPPVGSAPYRSRSRNGTRC